MQLTDLLGADVGVRAAVPITGLCLDSSQVQPGELFVALCGYHQHGLRFADEALRRGAAAILYDPNGDGEALAAALRARQPQPVLPLRELSQRLGTLADRFYHQPSARMSVVAVTGTNGKTSCTHFLARALAPEQSAGVIGTLGWGPLDALRPSTHTTPDAVAVHRMLGALAADGITTAAIEASSHGLAQGRLNGVRVTGALFTNISRDHLDYHEDVEAYTTAKLSLLHAPGLQFAVFNLDDPRLQQVCARDFASLRLYGYLPHGARAPTQASRCAGLLVIEAAELDGQETRFIARYGDAVAQVRAPVVGRFNLENLAGVLTVLVALGLPLETAAQRLARVRPVCGRLEVFRGSPGPTVVVDYAHTPDALEQALATLRPLCQGRLWVVFGCGGDRDRGKRPMMGAVAERLADRVIVTDDNPRTEDGEAIVQQIVSGMRRSTGLDVERNRGRAIEAAVAGAAEQDWILVAGKGHEQEQVVGHRRLPFSDQREVEAALALRQSVLERRA